MAKKKGSWVSWADFLGTAGNGGTWSKQTLLHFLEEYRDNIITAESSELLILLTNAGLEYKINTNEKFKKLILNEEGSDERKSAVDTLIEELISQVKGVDEEVLDEIGEILESDVEVQEANVSDEIDLVEETSVKLAPEAIIQGFKLYDHEYLHLENIDHEKVMFLIQNRINKLWNHFLNHRISIADIEKENGGQYFTQIKTAFLDEHREVIKIENPNGYCFKYEPMLMQKLVSYRLKTNKTYGNWSTVGAGKTLAGVYAGRYVGAKNTIVVTYNSTLRGWTKSLNSYFDDCIIYEKKMKNVVFEEGKNNYLLLNYEFFQQEHSENRLYAFMEKNRIDYVILDEVHSVKQRKEDNSLSTDDMIDNGFLSSRRRLMMKFLNDIRETNPDVYFMTMTATPIINNLVEAKKLLEMLQGEKFDELSTTDRNIKAGLEFHKHIVLNGIRYEHVPRNKEGNEVERIVIPIEIDGSELLYRLEGESSDLHIEQIVLDHKLEAVKPYIRKNTMIFTYYVEGITNKIKEYCEALGFKTALYTGRQSAYDREKNKELFQQGKIDVIIGSLPIGTGVDGFQEVCDRLICMSLPWTHSEFEQLVGRIQREGSPYKFIDVVIPKVMINYVDSDGLQKSWSRDRHKMNIINYKKDLFGIVVNGVIPSNIVTDLGSIKQKSIKHLGDIIERIKSGEISLGVNREELEKEFLEHNDEDVKRRRLSAFGELNQWWNHRNSSTVFDEIKIKPDIWHEYHKCYREVRQNWSREETPVFVIAEKINKLNKPFQIVGDFGCGDNLLKNEIKNTVLAFDFYAIDDDVHIADISKLPIENNRIHIGVYSLSLMGRNIVDILQEAKRVIAIGGRLYVAESLSKWENREDGIDELRVLVEAQGFEVLNMHTNDKFVFIDAINAL